MRPNWQYIAVCLRRYAHGTKRNGACQWHDKRVFCLLVLAVFVVCSDAKCPCWVAYDAVSCVCACPHAAQASRQCCVRSRDYHWHHIGSKVLAQYTWIPTGGKHRVSPALDTETHTHTHTHKHTEPQSTVSHSYPSWQTQGEF